VGSRRGGGRYMKTRQKKSLVVVLDEDAGLLVFIEGDHVEFFSTVDGIMREQKCFPATYPLPLPHEPLPPPPAWTPIQSR